VGIERRTLEALVSVVSPAMSALFGGAFSGRRVFVTGHTGFKGSWLAEWLIEMGADVTGYSLDPPTEPSLFDELGLAGRMRHVHGDVRDLPHLTSAIAEARPEIVFHLAAQALVRLSYEEPVLTYESNVMGTVNVLEAVRCAGDVAAVVNVTSDKCYENREDGRAYCETDPLGGHDPYSSSKGCAELVTAAYRRSFFAEPGATRIASVRAGNVIGGGDWAVDRIVPDCVCALQAGEVITVRNPDAVRPWQHVLEPLSGYLLLASRLLAGSPQLAGAWNFGPQDAGMVPVSSVADAIVAAWGSGAWECPVAPEGQPHEAQLLCLDVAKAKDALGWRPLYDVDRAVGVTAKWYRARAEGHDVLELTKADIADYVDEARRAGIMWSCAATTGEVAGQ
jgi:CDP-glucose 4,6-dehydratase